MASGGRASNTSADGARAHYALELYLPRLGGDALPAAAARARAAAEDMLRNGTPLRFVRSIFMPGDEICFLVFEGASAEMVEEMARRAAIAFERVVEIEVAADEPLADAARERSLGAVRDRKEKDESPAPRTSS